MRYFVTVGHRQLEVELGAEGISIDGKAIQADLVEMDGTDVHSLLLNGRSHRILAEREGLNGWKFHLFGHHLKASVVDERTKTIREMAGIQEVNLGPKALRAPMPGLVVKVEVEEGDEVESGQGLVIVEAMKMENELKSERGGRIRAVLVEAGQTVEKDQILVEFEAPDRPLEKGEGE
jgi:pyruvate carboxylase subunit B